MTVRRDLPTWIGALLAGAGLVWLGPLMADQFVLFADQGQAAAAAAARRVMLWPSLLVAGGAVAVAVRGRPIHGAIAALPVVAVVAALVMHDTALSFLGYAFSAPVAVGSVLAAAVPLARHRIRPIALLAGAAVLALLVVIANVVVLLACIAALAWITLSELPRRPADASALD